jgi:hypothetical protein
MIPLPYSESCERNKAPILEVLQQLLPSSGKILEIGSGTGQHIVYFAPNFPLLQWQPSDRDEYLPGLTARVEQEGSPNILPPIKLDVLEQWPDGRFDAAYSANTAHIMGWSFTAESNREFDRHLRSSDPQMGLRDLEALESLANRSQMVLQSQFPMPANNQILVFRKKGLQL